jgi:hypothetical protein
MNFDFDKPTTDLFIGGIIFPNVPFQVCILDPVYAKMFQLPYKQALTVVGITYSVQHRQVRYTLREFIFDFPWNHEAIQVIHSYNTN